MVSGPGSATPAVLWPRGGRAPQELEGESEAGGGRGGGGPRNLWQLAGGACGQGGEKEPETRRSTEGWAEGSE